MQLVSKEGGLVRLSFVMDEVKPLGGIYLPQLFDAIGRRYHFAKVPTLEETARSGAIFKEGFFALGGKVINLLDAGVFNDGLRVTAVDTADAELVLDDLVAWLQTELGFRKPETLLTKAYQSDVVVRFDNDPAEILSCPPLTEFAQEQMAPNVPKLGFGGITFAADATKGGYAEFTVQRRYNVPWETGLWFSKAHMQTLAHLAALDLLDRHIGKRR